MPAARIHRHFFIVRAECLQVFKRDVSLGQSCPSFLRHIIQRKLTSWQTVSLYCTLARKEQIFWLLFHSQSYVFIPKPREVSEETNMIQQRYSTTKNSRVGLVKFGLHARHRNASLRSSKPRIHRGFGEFLCGTNHKGCCRSSNIAQVQAKQEGSQPKRGFLKKPLRDRPRRLGSAPLRR